MALQYYEGIGRRKQSTARARIVQGTGQFIVNEKTLDDYFTRVGDKENILAPFITTGFNQDNHDVTVIVRGGGVTGQSDSVKLGVARALVEINQAYTSELRKGGHLTRDPRVKERKKPGLKSARKAPTYTKR